MRNVCAGCKLYQTTIGVLILEFILNERQQRNMLKTAKIRASDASYTTKPSFRHSTHIVLSTDSQKNEKRMSSNEVGRNKTSFETWLYSAYESAFLCTAYLIQNLVPFLQTAFNSQVLSFEQDSSPDFDTQSNSELNP